MSETCLFIGGIADGRWIAVTAGISYWRVPHPLRPTVSIHGALEPFEPGAYTMYRRQEFHTPGRQYALYIVEGMDVGEVFDRLLHGYKPASEEEVQP